jgi:hypothetical protein
VIQIRGLELASAVLKIVEIHPEITGCYHLDSIKDDAAFGGTPKLPCLPVFYSLQGLSKSPHSLRYPRPPPLLHFLPSTVSLSAYFHPIESFTYAPMRGFQHSTLLIPRAFCLAYLSRRRGSLEPLDFSSKLEKDG